MRVKPYKPRQKIPQPMEYWVVEHRGKTAIMLYYSDLNWYKCGQTYGIKKVKPIRKLFLTSSLDPY